MELTEAQSLQPEPNYDDDLKLVAAVRNKDRKATSDFVSLYSDGLYRYVRRRMIPRVEIVDDIVQEVFLAALDSLPQYRGNASLKTWLLAIARHKVDDHYRAFFRRSVESDSEEEARSVASDHPSLDEMIDRAQLENKVRRVFLSLPELYSMVLLWRYWEGQSARDIAERTGKTEKAVERMLARARAQFKRMWTHE